MATDLRSGRYLDAEEAVEYGLSTAWRRRKRHMPGVPELGREPCGVQPSVVPMADHCLTGDICHRAAPGRVRDLPRDRRRVPLSADHDAVISHLLECGLRRPRGDARAQRLDDVGAVTGP